MLRWHMPWEAQPFGKWGRQHAYSDAAIPPRKNVKLWKPAPPELGRETKRFDPQSIWVAHCGGM